MRKLLAILQIFVLMAAMALPTAFAAEAPIMLAGLEAASSSSSTATGGDQGDGSGDGQTDGGITDWWASLWG